MKKVTFLFPKDLRYECQKCGWCCRWNFDQSLRDLKAYAKALGTFFYGPDTFPSNLPLLTVFEVREVSKALKVSPREIFHILQTVLKKESYRIVNVFFTFKLTREYGSCIFLDEETNLCKIHRIKPLACRTYPFYHDPLLGNKDEICIAIDGFSPCPGIGRGPRVKRSKIAKLIKRKIELLERSHEYWTQKNLSAKKLIEETERLGRALTPSESYKLLDIWKYV